MSNLLSRLLAQKDVVVADGAMGTNLFLLGLGKGDNGAAWNVERPEAVKGIHQGFVDAGSDILLTNTFGANRIRLALHQMDLLKIMLINRLHGGGSAHQGMPVKEAHTGKLTSIAASGGQ